MDITVRQIRGLVAVADTGSFSSAAAALDVSQSSITESIQALEKRVGVKLFKRAGRGVSLTQDGYRFLSHGRKILDSIADATRALQHSGQSLTGSIRLGVSPVVSGYFLAHPLSQFRDLHPNVQITLTELQPTEIEQPILEQKIDVAILPLFPLRHPKKIETRIIFSAKRRLWLSTRHHLLAARAIRLADVANEPYLLHTPDDNTTTTLRYWGKYRLKPSVHFATVSIEAIRSLVAAGVGVTILSDLVYRPWSLDGERIESRALVDPLPDLKIAVAWKKNRKFDPTVTTFLKFFFDRSAMDAAMRRAQGQRD